MTILAIDIGATNTRIGLFSNDGKSIWLKRVKTSEAVNYEPAGEAIPKLIINTLKEAVENSEIHSDDLRSIEAIGIGCIGPIDFRLGIIKHAPNLPSKLKDVDINIVKPLAKYFKKPTYMVNDCVAAVYGEKIFGTGRNYENLVYITISTGIGGGVIIDDNLIFGKDGNAHEVGHIVIDKDAVLTCGCGGKGHWEAYCSGSGIPNYVEYLISNKLVKSLSSESQLYQQYLKTGKVSARELYHYAKMGDELALEIVWNVGKLNAIGVASVINVYDPEIVILGGAVVLNNEELVIKPINQYVNDYVMNRLAEIEVTRLRDEVVLYGALAIALEPPRKLRQVMEKLW